MRQGELELTVSSSDKPAAVEGFPMKEWTIEIYVLDQDGREHPANCFTKVTYNLHPSFEQPTQSKYPTLPMTSIFVPC